MSKQRSRMHRIGRREFLAQLGVVGAAVSGCRFTHRSSSPIAVGDRRPNILFLLTDDQRWDALGCMGNPVIQTPNLDGIAENGVIFTNAFVTTSICASSRASVLSGQHMRTHGIRDFAKAFTPEAFQQTYPAILRGAGYRTGFIGKWGVGAMRDEHLEYPASQFDYWRGFKQQGEYMHEVNGRRRHMSQIMADQAIEFLHGSSAEQPFCLSISFKAPHGPWQAFDPDFEDLFKDKEMPVAPSATEAAEAAQPEFIRNSLGGRVGRSGIKNFHEWVRWYYRLVKGVDVALGRILSALDELGYAENTAILFTSDNGHFLYEHGQIGKWLMYEESIRVPMIVYDPRLPANLRGRRREEMVLNIDCAPTILTLAGLPVPEAMQGRDLGPLLRGEEVQDWRTEWFYEHTYCPPNPERYIPMCQGVRAERWKYIRYIDQDPPYEQLFDLETDPYEMNNLAGRAKTHPMLAPMRNRYESYLVSIPNTDPRYP